MSNIASFSTAQMTSAEISDLVESRHDDTKRAIKRLADREVIKLPPLAEVKNHLGQKVKVYIFDQSNKRDSYVVVAQLSPEFTARLVDRWQELEGQKTIAVPQTLPEALRLAAEAIEERDKAIATKAEIGSRREATAMATASAAARKAKKLEIELDKSQEYCSIKRMQSRFPEQKFNWRRLKAFSQDMGIPAQDVFDSNYGTVKAYHSSVWKAAYSVDLLGEAA